MRWYAWWGQLSTDRRPRTAVPISSRRAGSRPAPDHLLWASRGADDEFQTLTVPMAICNALVLTIAKRNRTRSMQALDRLGGLIEAFEK